MTRKPIYRVDVQRPNPDAPAALVSCVSYVSCVDRPHLAALVALRARPDQATATVSEQWRPREYVVHGVWRREGNRIVKD